MVSHDSASGRLIGATASTGETFHIDIETGTTFNHLSTNVPFEGVGAEYDPNTDSLLVSTGSNLYSVDLTDGSTFLGAMEGHDVDFSFSVSMRVYLTPCILHTGHLKQRDYTEHSSPNAEPDRR